MLLVLQLLSGLFGAAAYADGGTGSRSVTVPQAIGEAAQWLVDKGPVRDDWVAYALAAAGKPVEAGYLTDAAQRAQALGGSTVATTYARIALGVKAAGGDPTSIGGKNVIAALYNHPDLTAQGTNGAIYALLALNSGSYTIPNDALWNQESLVAWLLSHQVAGHGWALYPDAAEADLDITGAALWALEPYKDRPAVQTAASQAAQWFAGKQLESGDFAADRDNSNSLSMVVLGLASQQKDGRQGSFAKSGGNLVSALFQYFTPDGGFAFKAGSAAESSATYQGLQALVAFNALTGGQSGSFEAPLGSGSEQGKASVFVHIEGRDGPLAEGTERAANPLEALELLAARNGLTIGTSDSPFFDVYRIGDVVKDTSSGYYYWGFYVKRAGVWTADWDWKNTALQTGDELAIVYGEFGVPKIDQVKVTPEEPKNNEPFQVKVSQVVTVNSETVTIADAVYVQIGSQKVWSDAQGVAVFPNGYTAQDKEIVVTGYMKNGFPSVVRGVVQLPPRVDVRVEGPQSTMAVASAHGTTAYKALANSVQEVVYTNVEWFGITKINGLEPSGNDYWGFALRRAGNWVETGAWDTTPTQDGDELVVYYARTTDLINSVTALPTVPKAGQSFSIQVNKENYQKIVSPAAGVQVKVGTAEATTDAQGFAVFSGGLAEGVYAVAVTGYQPGQAPTVVKHTGTLTVAAAGNSGGGSTPSVPTATVRVIGDDSRGELLSGQSVKLITGDTAYSVLVRALGADRVESSGTGSNIYVSGIDGLRQFDQGAKSGWMYAVNCAFPSGSAGTYAVRAGDKVEWWYTLNGGDDVKAVSKETCVVPSSGSGSTSSPLTTIDLEGQLATLGIDYSNKKPADRQEKTVVVVNFGFRMSAAASADLKKELDSNPIQLQKAVTPTASATLTDAKEEVKLALPSLAVKQETQLTVDKLSATDREELLSGLYEFKPSGTVFDKPVYITITTPLGDATLDALALAWLNEETGEWIPIPAVVDAATGKVTGAVNHFTKFAVIDKTKLPAGAPAGPDVAKAVSAAVRYVQNDADLSDWEAYALATAGVQVPSSYLASVQAQLKEKEGKLRNVTDYERLAIGVKAAGGNPFQIAGVNLPEAIAASERMTAQGTNGPIFALLAMNFVGYEPPSDALWTKEKLLSWLLAQQNGDGGWPLAPGDESNIDLTAMAVTALAELRTQPGVGAAIDKALGWMSARQQPDGGFALSGVANSESAAQVVLALASLGLEQTDARFVKANGSALTNLIGFQQPDGGFAHVKGEASGAIATEQALLALATVQQAAGRTATPDNAVRYADEASISPWAVEAVAKATRYGLMDGTGGETPRFTPQGALTRAQFVVIMVRLLDKTGQLPAPVAGSAAFADVPTDAWYADYVTKAALSGIVKGVSETSFAPEQSVTRQEMALVATRALKLTQASEASAAAFADLADALPEAVPAIAAVAEQGYMEGVAAERFAPTGTVTREMAAAVMVRMFEKNKK